jgi:hypothetical protein
VVYATGGEDDVVHSHWTTVNDRNETITLALKLWRPEDWNSSRLLLAFSVLSIPSTGLQLEEWKSGVEFVLSNKKSGIIAGGKVHH